MQKPDSHKFISRKDGRVIYFSDEGKKQFAKTKRINDFKYVGTVTDEERQKEVADAANKKPVSFDEAKKENKTLVEKVKAPVKELDAEELAALEENTTTVGDEDELTPAQKKKLEKDKAKLAEKNGEEV
jgi:hypothetical protein